MPVYIISCRTVPDWVFIGSGKIDGLSDPRAADSGRPCRRYTGVRAVSTVAATRSAPPDTIVRRPISVPVSDGGPSSLESEHVRGGTVRPPA